MATKRKAVKKAPKARVAKLTIDESKIAGLTVERIPVSLLKPHPKNPRKHPAKGSPEWEVLTESLQHDYFDPLVWNRRNGMLVSGHLRTKVFKHLGYTHADVVVVDYDEQTHVARMIAANKSIGQNDTGRLVELFAGLKHDEFNLSLTGFTLPEVEDLASIEEETLGADAAEADEDRYTTDDVKLIEKWFGKGAVPTLKTANGNVWRVGDNYMYVGSVLNDHTAYVPLLGRLQEEFPSRKVLLVPMPDPIMVSHADKRVACVFVQPSPVAAALALTLTKKIRPNHRVELTNDDKKTSKAKKRAK